MDRGDLKDLGEQLDAGEVGLVVIAAANLEAKVEEVIRNAQEVTKRELQALEAELDQEVAQPTTRQPADPSSLMGVPEPGIGPRP